jgi:Tfp pilus assembly protein PilO
MMHRIHIDFGAARRGSPWLGWLLLAIAAAVCLDAGLAYKGLRDALKINEARLPRTAPPKVSPQEVAAVYDFLQKGEDTTDWLAKLHGIGTATGVQLRSASYRTQQTEGARIERYEIVLPVSGSYAQIRDFLKRALVEIPVMSLDSLSLKRKDDGIQAQMRLTIHRVRS